MTVAVGGFGKTVKIPHKETHLIKFIITFASSFAVLQVADILKKRRCSNALSAVIRISQIQTLLYDKAMTNAHVFGIYIICIYDKRGLSALLILSRRQCESLDDGMSKSSDTRASFFGVFCNN